MSNNKNEKHSRGNILAESWSAISNEYEKVLVPRFQPWTKEALCALEDALSTHQQSDGTPPPSALVLCCGPGQELIPLARMLPHGAKVLGTDLAPGMIAATRRRIEVERNTIQKDYNITAEVGNAMNPPTGPYDVIFSAFGLQQLPKPISAVETWIDRTKENGICGFIYWPPNTPRYEEDINPFDMWSDLVKSKLGKQSTEECEPWDENIVSTITDAGGDIISDKFITHDIRWENGQELFDGMSRAGPWHARRLVMGDAWVDDLGSELIEMFPPDNPVCHKFTARMIIARRGTQKVS